MNTQRTKAPRTCQSGFALITTLILLVITSLLGVMASQIVLMGERSGRYERDRQIAFQAAEAALLDAELDIRGPGSARSASFSPTSTTGFEEGCGTSGDSRGLCLPAIAGTAPPWTHLDFASGDAPVPFGTFTGRPYASGEDGAQSRIAPRYLIELVPDPTPGGSAGTPRNLYRVTAVGFGPRVDTQVMLQMFFRKE
jgi:type IV pilus assembly protein PilX